MNKNISNKTYLPVTVIKATIKTGIGWEFTMENYNSANSLFSTGCGRKISIMSEKTQAF